MTKKQKNITQNDFPLFSYRIGYSCIHKMPTLLKVFLLFVFPISIFVLPLHYIGILSIVCILLSLYAGFSLKEQIYSVKPILIYCLFLCIVYVSGLLFSQESNGLYYFTLGTKLICSMQWTSLFFKTTTSISLQQALEKILPFSVARMFSLFITFIPMLFLVWFTLERSWKARGGKNGVRKIFTLLPIFISLSLHKAYNVSITIQNRS